MHRFTGEMSVRQTVATPDFHKRLNSSQLARKTNARSKSNPMHSVLSLVDDATFSSMQRDCVLSLCLR